MVCLRLFFSRIGADLPRFDIQCKTTRTETVKLRVGWPKCTYGPNLRQTLQSVTSAIHEPERPPETPAGLSLLGSPRYIIRASGSQMAGQSSTDNATPGSPSLCFVFLEPFRARNSVVLGPPTLRHAHNLAYDPVDRDMQLTGSTYPRAHAHPYLDWRAEN